MDEKSVKRDERVGWRRLRIALGSAKPIAGRLRGRGHHGQQTLRNATPHHNPRCGDHLISLALQSFWEAHNLHWRIDWTSEPPRRREGKRVSDGGTAQGEAGSVPSGHGGAMEVGSGGAHPPPNLVPLLPMDALAVSHPFVDARWARQRRFALGGSPQGTGTRARAER